VIISECWILLRVIVCVDWIFSHSSDQLCIVHFFTQVCVCLWYSRICAEKGR